MAAKKFKVGQRVYAIGKIYELEVISVRSLKSFKVKIVGYDEIIDGDPKIIYASKSELIKKFISQLQEELKEVDNQCE